MSRTRTARPEQAWVNGADQFRIAQQYKDMPQHGLVFRVEQRTTGAGRAVLLTPQQVAEVHTWLGEWLANGTPAKSPDDGYDRDMAGPAL